MCIAVMYNIWLVQDQHVDRFGEFLLSKHESSLIVACCGPHSAIFSDFPFCQQWPCSMHSMTTHEIFTVTCSSLNLKCQTILRRAYGLHIYRLLTFVCVCCHQLEIIKMAKSTICMVLTSRNTDPENPALPTSLYKVKIITVGNEISVLLHTQRCHHKILMLPAVGGITN